jgi:hypothetical protein
MKWSEEIFQRKCNSKKNNLSPPICLAKKE